MPFDPRTPLALPRVYRLLQGMLSGPRTMDRMVREILGIRADDRVLDIGCGPATLLRHMPPVDYWGVDMSERYIVAAKAAYGGRGNFMVGRISEDTSSADFSRLGRFDKVLAIGLLHHLDDAQAAALLRAIPPLLKPGGLLITFDNVFIPRQNPVARTLIRLDRGRHVRDETGYRALAVSAFRDVTVSVLHDLLRLPYTHIVMECQ